MERSGTELARALIQHFFNAHDPDTAAEYFAPGLTWHGGSVGTIEGVDAYAEVMRAFFQALPDAHATEKEMVEVGDRVVARFVVEGTHDGEFWGIPPTGRKISWDATMIYHLVDGKVAEQWAAEDWAGILQQIGVITPPWASTDALAEGLVRIGEEAIAKQNDSALDAYFADDFVFHGPSGDTTLDDLKQLWAGMREAFSDFSVTRDQILVHGNVVAARTRMSGIFEHVFAYSPIGLVQPTGKAVSFQIINIFRYDNDGRLAEEWAQLDNLGLLRQLGVNVP